jgi:ketosteroid isomerase-like protein
MPVTTEDYVGVADHIGRYCWTVDSGDGKAYAALWTEDGVFTGIAPEPVSGPEALAMVSTQAFKDFGGKMCHLAGNIFCDYVEDSNTVIAHLYNYVTNWPVGGGQHFVLAKCKMTLVRNGKGWLIKKNEAELLAGAPEPAEG